MKDSLKFKGSKLIVQEAADPSTILWENLKVIISKYFLLLYHDSH